MPFELFWDFFSCQWQSQTYHLSLSNCFLILVIAQSVPQNEENVFLFLVFKYPLNPIFEQTCNNRYVQIWYVFLHIFCQHQVHIMADVNGHVFQIISFFHSGF